MRIKIADIKTDPEMQNRVTMKAERVDGFTQAIQEGEAIEPIEVVKTKAGTFWLVDGFHRRAGAIKAGETHIEADVTNGTKQDALWRSCAANKEHDRAGLYRSNADKQKAVAKALRLKPGMSDRAIASHVGVTHNTVRKTRGEMEAGGEIDHLDTREGTDGKTYTLPPPPDEEEQVQEATALPPPPEDPEEKETPESEEIDRLTDEVGYPIPEHLEETWNERNDTRGLIRKLKQVRRDIQAESEVNPMLHPQTADNEIKRAIRELENAVPYAVCPYCLGDGDCEACKGVGLVSKFTWKSVCAKEVKEAMIQSITNN